MLRREQDNVICDRLRKSCTTVE